MLTCPHCREGVRTADLHRQRIFAGYRTCPHCGKRFRVDAKTKRRQVAALVVALISLGFTLLWYYRSPVWVSPAILSYLALAWIIYRGNKRVVLVPYEEPGDDAAR